MVNFTNIEGKALNLRNHTPAEEGLINKTLPQEIFQHILSYLDDRDLRQASYVSSVWSGAALDTAKQEEHHKMGAFAHCLCAHLDNESYENQRKEVLHIYAETPIFNVTNLRQVRSSSRTFRQSTINVLKQLKQDDLKRLSQGERLPIFIKGIFDDAYFGRQLDEVDSFNHACVRNTRLRFIVVELTESGRFDQAIEVAKRISDHTQGLSFFRICQVLAGRSQYDQAIQLANKISGNDFKGFALQNICLELAIIGRADTAIETSNMIPTLTLKTQTLRMICKALAIHGRLERAAEVAKSIPDDVIRIQVLAYIEDCKKS